MSDKIKHFPTQTGRSITCDFRKSTWTFEMPKDFAFTGGSFAIIPNDEYEKMKAEILASGNGDSLLIRELFEELDELSYCAALNASKGLPFIKKEDRIKTVIDKFTSNKK